MITKNNLPVAYRPYGRLNLCSNLLIGGGHLIQIGDVLPLLIGKGDVPQVWLQAPTDRTGKRFSELVVGSVAAHPAVLVNTDDGVLSIGAGGKTILRVHSTGPDDASVDLLDLRSIGFNIFGDSQSLNVSGMHMSRNTVAGGGTFLALGDLA